MLHHLQESPLIQLEFTDIYFTVVEPNEPLLPLVFRLAIIGVDFLN